MLNIQENIRIIVSSSIHRRNKITRMSVEDEKDDLMEYTEDEYLMISGIQHFKFCRRQWALIHIEQQWAENVHTVVGELMHKKVA